MTVLPTVSPVCHFLLITTFAVTTSDALATLSISDGVNGGQCSLVGTWDAASKTCTLNSDVADSVQIDSPGVTLDCERHRIAAPAGNPGLVVPVGSDGVTIYDCDVTQVGPFAAGIEVSSNDSRIVSNTVSTEWCGIDVLFGTDNEVSDNTVIGVINPSFCPYLPSCILDEPFAFGLFALLSSRNIINNNHISATSRGISLDEASDNVIADNSIQNRDNIHSANSRSIGIFLIEASDNVIADNTIQADRAGIEIEVAGDFNLIDSNVVEARTGIVIQGTAPNFPQGPFDGPSFNTIVNNDITGFDITGLDNRFASGIFLNTGTDDNLIHANRIFVDDPGAATIFGAGIFFDVAADRNTVTSNTIVTTGSDGISMESGSGVGNNNHVWQGNTITGAHRAMVVRGDNNLVEDNLLRRSGGARLVGGSHNVLKNNVIELGINTVPIECFDTTMPFPIGVPCNLNNGITLVEETDTVLDGNTIRRMPGHAIVAESSLNLQLLRNTLHQNGGNGLTLKGSPGTDVSLNDIWLNAGFAVNSDSAIELSVDGKGNWWNGNCGKGLFVPGPGPGADSNAPDVVDLTPYKGAISHVPNPNLPVPCPQ